MKTDSELSTPITDSFLLFLYTLIVFGVVLAFLIGVYVIVF